MRAALIVRNIEAGPFEQDIDVAANEALHRAAAGRTHTQRFILNGLTHLKYSTIVAFVVVRRHRDTPLLK
jgi:hypothetical protein